MNGMGQRIKLRRKEQKLTQAEFAEKLGVSPNHVSAIELNRRFTELLVELYPNKNNQK